MEIRSVQVASTQQKGMQQELPPDERSSADPEGEFLSFLEFGDQVLASVTNSITAAEAPNQFDDSEDCVYLKTTDKRFLYANRKCHEVFTSEKMLVGRVSDSLIGEKLATLANYSDAMILHGCRRVTFEHLGNDKVGKLLRLITIKYSLMGLAQQSAAAILGITRVCEVLDDDDPTLTQVSQLDEKWTCYMKMDQFDQQVGIQLAKGRGTGEISQALNCSKRTVENHRGEVLKQLGVGSTIDLAKLLVRFQERGYGELGI